MSIWLLPGPQKVRGVTFDLHTLLFGAMSVLMGFQSIYFATFSKVFAIREGLLPEDRRLTRLFRYITLEIGLAIGAVLALLGAGTWVFGLAYWSARHFGALEPEKTLRIVIPGLVFLTMGGRSFFPVFFSACWACAVEGRHNRDAIHDAGWKAAQWSGLSPQSNGAG